MFRKVREMDDFILHLVWSHPKAVRLSGTVLAEAGLAQGNVAGCVSAALAGAWMVAGSHASYSSECRGP